MHSSVIMKIALALTGFLTLATALPVSKAPHSLQVHLLTRHQTASNAIAASSAQDLIKDPNGHIAFDADGVLRSYNGDNQVIGYYQLNPTQITNMIDNLPADFNKTAMAETFTGVDGTKVTGKPYRSLVQGNDTH